MTLLSLLSHGRSTILEAWQQRVLDTYPAQAADRFRRERDPFLNPVGAAVTEALAELLDGLLAGTSAEDLAASLDRVIRVRAVQDFSPSAAVGFLLELKPILRQVAETQRPGGVPANELLALETAVDRLALRGFDQYMACREKLSEIRINEIRNQSHLALKQAGLLGHGPESGRAPGCSTERGRQS